MSILVASFSFQFRARRYLTKVESVTNARSSMEAYRTQARHAVKVGGR